MCLGCIMAIHETQKRCKTHVTCYFMLASNCFTFIWMSKYVTRSTLAYVSNFSFSNLTYNLIVLASASRKQPISTTLVYHTSCYNWNKGFKNCFYNRPCHCTRNLVGQCFSLTIIAHNKLIFNKSNIDTFDAK